MMAVATLRKQLRKLETLNNKSSHSKLTSLDEGMN